MNRHHVMFERKRARKRIDCLTHQLHALEGHPGTRQLMREELRELMWLDEALCLEKLTQATERLFPETGSPKG